MGAGYLPRLAWFLLALSTVAHAAPKARTATGAPAQPAASTARAGKARAAAPAPDTSAATPPAHDAPEKSVQGQPKAGPSPTPATAVQTEENKEGVKTYKFGAVEVESRLKSPELIYFMRRVRAEFAAGELGHRSFMPELHSTERLPTFR